MHQYSRSVDLAGRNALVTGVSRRAGIGFAITRHLLNAGASMFVQGWTAHDAAQPWGAETGGTEAVARELGVPFIEADFADPASPAEVVSGARSALGPLDLLIVNHARSGLGRLGELTAEEIDASCTRTSALRFSSSKSSPPSTTRVVPEAASSCSPLGSTWRR